MKLASLFLLPATAALAFAPPQTKSIRKSSSPALFASSQGQNDDDGLLSRRAVLGQSVAMASTLSLLSLSPLPALSDDAAISTVVVAGSTGQTGRRIVERLASRPATSVVAGVRNVAKAQKSLSESSTVVRGAMVQTVPSVSASSVSLKELNVVSDSVDAMAETLKGADSLVIAVGFVPGNPLKMNDAAHEVDNVGTCKLIDAAKKAGVKKVVMVSSILTNGRNWRQEKSPGFIVTNAFGNVLDEKLVAENYLRQSGLDYTIVRPGGLKAKPPAGPLKISGEDTLNAGEISRDLVADVCVACLTDEKAKNKVLEIIEEEEGGPQVFNGLNM
mmetsp:Transcript_32178/g.63738  ORF Transcript_32178/g.63738 Transcript_32178/m.63738 type:complete len:331 (-) Transcript_32178:211-1203(-)